MQAHLIRQRTFAQHNHITSQGVTVFESKQKIKRKIEKYLLNK